MLFKSPVMYVFGFFIKHQQCTFTTILTVCHGNSMTCDDLIQRLRQDGSRFEINYPEVGTFLLQDNIFEVFPSLSMSHDLMEQRTKI